MAKLRGLWRIVRAYWRGDAVIANVSVAGVELRALDECPCGNPRDAAGCSVGH